MVTRFNQLNETIAKLCDRKEYYKGETVSLSGSLSDNRDALVEANKIIIIIIIKYISIASNEAHIIQVQYIQQENTG